MGGLMLVLLSVALLAITFFYGELQGFFPLWVFSLIVGCLLIFVGKKALDKNLKERAQAAEAKQSDVCC
jgi:uncharacterized membrane protein